MIGQLTCRVGEKLQLSGYANDFDRSICAIEFSLNEGKSWTIYPTPGTESDLNLYWSFDFTPTEPGTYEMLIRSVNSLGETSPIPARVTIVVE